MRVSTSFGIVATSLILLGCASVQALPVQLGEGVDVSAGGDAAYIITTPNATYYLEKQGGGLSSMLDRDGIDWLGFHKAPGSGHKGEYRGFPNAVHKQDGNYFHAMNAKTDPSTTKVELVTDTHVRIGVVSGNGKWEAQYDFFADRLDFTMRKVSPGYKYWVQYEGVPGGEMDDTDFRYASADTARHPINEPFIGDLPAPEWMAFGDANASRMIYLLHHEDDRHPDDYVSRPHMTVLGIGRRNKDKYLTSPQKFSIGFIESTEHDVIADAMRDILD